MNLSKRLSTVSNMVINCDTACDIGCDHGYVSIDLVNRNVARRVIACDINEGPLLAASENIAAAGLSDRIETRLSDGLHKVTTTDKPDVIIAAGMGGQLMSKILDEGKEVVKGASQLVLQPQSELFLVRKWLRQNGYTIVREEILTDASKYYFVMDARPGNSKEYEHKLQELFDSYSEYLIKEKNPLFKEYLERGISVNKSYMEGIAPGKEGVLLLKTNEMETVLSMMD